MRYKYKGFRGCDASCDIEVHGRSDGKYVFIATEVADNPCTSITNGSWSEDPKGNEGALKSPQL